MSQVPPSFLTTEYCFVNSALTSSAIVACWMSIVYHAASGGELDLNMCLTIVDTFKGHCGL